MDKDIEITNRLTVLRAEKKLSQQELATRVGVSRQTINSLEKNKYSPSLKLAFKLADLFQIDVNDIFSYTIQK